MKKIIIHFLILVVIIPNLFAQSDSIIKTQDFYTGNIFIESINGIIKINKNNILDLNFDVNISGKKYDNEEVSMSFRGGEISKTKEKVFKIKPKYSITGEGSPTKSIKFDVVPLINGQIPNRQIGKSLITVELPEDFIFIRANKSLVIRKNGMNNILEYKEENKYITPLVIVYNTNGMGISLEKKITNGIIKKGSVTFILNITNIGVKELTNIIIEDNFDPNDFTAQGNEYTIYKGKINDSRIIWKKKIDSLKPGENLKIEYTLNANYDVKDVSLDAAKATVDGVLIGVSNKVKL